MNFINKFSVLFILVCLTFNFSSTYADETKSKSTNKTTNQEKSKSKKSLKLQQKWEQEPISFMRVELGKPLLNSAPKICPNGFGPEITQEYYKIVREQKLLCYNDGLTGKVGTFDLRFSVWEHAVEVFDQRLLVKTYDDKPDGNVGAVEVLFPTANFTLVKEMLTSKYGESHQHKVGKVKTLGGAEFDNSTMIWSGSKVSIKLQSLMSREVQGGSIIEYGSVLVTLNDYLSDKASGVSSDIKRMSDKL